MPEIHQNNENHPLGTMNNHSTSHVGLTDSAGIEANSDVMLLQRTFTLTVYNPREKEAQT